MPTQSKALVPKSLTPAAWRMIQSVSPSIYAARRWFGVMSPDEAAVIMLRGYELGFALSESFDFIHVVEGKPSLSPRGAMALIHASGLLEGFRIDEKPGSCTVWMRRKNQDGGDLEYKLTWTLDDAKAAGLVRSNSAWEKYPANMLRWRCVGFVADVLFPDVTGGLRRSDEYGAAVDVSGDVVESDVVEGEVRVVSPISAVVEELERLIAKYGAEAVIQANNNQVPTTEAEIDELERRLAESPETESPETEVAA